MMAVSRTLSNRAPGRAGSGVRQRGVSLAEVLVALAVMGLFLMVVLPAVANYIRAARVRTAANILSKDLSSCRYIAVTTRTTRTLALTSAVPATSYTYTDVRGRVQTVLMPQGVTITSATNFPVTFTALGGLQGSPASLVLKGTVTTGVAHEWTLAVNNAGKVTTTTNRSASP